MNTKVYVADTLGETGTWYALCPIVFLGGSLKEIGGHNPFEPAQAGAAVITGPGYFNFAETFAPADQNRRSRNQVETAPKIWRKPSTTGCPTIASRDPSPHCRQRLRLTPKKTRCKT